jgi:hypothetical protein
LCEQVAAQVRAGGAAVRNLAGATTLREFIELASVCRVFLTNDSGAMHVASALGVPTVAVFGATDDVTTGPAGPLAHVVREHAECSPCLLRDCPIDHRCMTRVSVDRVAAAAAQLALLLVDLQLAGAGDARPAHAAGDDGRVAGHAAPPWLRATSTCCARNMRASSRKCGGARAARSSSWSSRGPKRC